MKGKGKARADPQGEEVAERNDESDASDEDYAAPSESDGGEPSDRKSTRLNSSHSGESRMPSSA